MPTHEFLGNTARVFTDASHTYGSHFNTGVQRVVRSVCELAPKCEAAQQVEAIAYKNGGLAFVDMAENDRKFNALRKFRANIASHLPASYRIPAETLCRLVPIPTLRKWTLPEPGHQGAFKLPLKLVEACLTFMEAREYISAKQGDLLILPDAYWAKEQVWPEVAKAKEDGAKIAVVVYDLIPLTHPEFVSPKATESFRRYLKLVAQHADMIVAISDTVRQQVEELLKTPEYDTQCKHFASFELGAEFDEPRGDVRESVKAVFPEDAHNAPHLMVATFDPRKNHHYAMDAFEKIWETQPTRKLCFVGRVGWLCEDVIERMQKHPRFGKQLFGLHDVSDAELNYCYKRARSVVFPSIVEGFGLPIVEALWHGRHVFASDTAIHREVGRDECSYCDLADPASLAEQILAWEAKQDAFSPSRQSTYRPVSWQQSINSLVSQCAERLFAQPEEQTESKRAA